MKNIQKTLSILPSCKKSSKSAVLSIVIICSLTSCNVIEPQADRFADIYRENTPLTMNPINPNSTDPISFAVDGFDNMNLNVGSEQVLLKKTLSFDSEEVNRGVAFRESEERRSKTRYLTLR
jgi:hypothetical protein